MYDETPDYFIRDGKIFAHHKGSTYYSGGFREHEPSYDTQLCNANPYNINKYLEKSSIYNYDSNRWEKKYTSDYHDAYGYEIYIGSHVLFMDCDGSGGFLGYVKGIVTGFTNNYVKIENLKYDRINRYHDLGRCCILRTPHRIICIENL